MNGMFRNNIKVGSEVDIVQKADQPTGKRTHGEVARILTKKARHTRGIKVQLVTGEIGRVQYIIEK